MEKEIGNISEDDRLVIEEIKKCKNKSKLRKALSIGCILLSCISCFGAGLCLNFASKGQYFFDNIGFNITAALALLGNGYFLNFVLEPKNKKKRIVIKYFFI